MHAAKSQLSRLVQQAEHGQEVVIARGRTAVAKIVAIDAATPERAFGAMKGRARVTRAFFEPLPDDELSAWGE
jgi:antitoxin (DNA-binding transcriptional repressor) of toxin-antitoxin stability system